MKSHSKWILPVIIIIMIAVVIYFVYPGITSGDAHLQANKLFNEGAACEFRQDYTCAMERYQQAIAMYGKDSHYYVFLADLQARQGKYAEAIDNYIKAKSIDPANESILPGLNNALKLQATQTALSRPTTQNSPTALSLPASQSFPTATRLSAATQVQSRPQPEAIYPIFDEEFGIIKWMATISQSLDDNIKYEITNQDAFSGKYSLLVSWHKNEKHWASLVLGFDSDNDPKKATAGQMASINLAPPSDYALEFFAKRARPFEMRMASTLMDDSITLKFQDQNVLFHESLGNQAVYIYKLDPNGGFIPDGRIPLNAMGWQKFCLPLARFDTDYWIKETYESYSEADRQFDWSNVKQINIDANFFSVDGAVYVDALRIIRASDCAPFPK